MIDLIESYIRYGVSWTALIYFMIRNRRLRKYINNSLPRILRDNADNEIAEIKHDVKLIKAHLGVKGEWISNTNGLKRVSTLLYKRFYSLSLGGILLKFRFKKARKKKMKEYLKKLGRTKFQAFIVITVTNVLMLVGYIMNVANIQEIANEWMPAINLVSQLLATVTYQLVEGSIDKAREEAKPFIKPPEESESQFN